jgi:hypothetical protein
MAILSMKQCAAHCDALSRCELRAIKRANVRYTVDRARRKDSDDWLTVAEAAHSPQALTTSRSFVCFIAKLGM